MKTTTKAILLILILSACKSDSELPDLNSSELKEVKEKTDNGYEINTYYRDTLRHGKYEKYNSNGKLDRKGFYYDDAMTGRWEFYDSTGSLYEVRYYHLNDISGPDTMYYPNGNLKRTGFFSSGREQGPWTYYYPDGNKKSELTFVDGLPLEDSYKKYDSLPIE